MDVSASAPCQLTITDEQRIEKNEGDALNRKGSYNERIKLEQANRKRVTKMARTTVTSAQPSHSLFLSKPATFMEKTHRLCRACGAISILQKRSVSNIRQKCDRVFI